MTRRSARFRQAWGFSTGAYCMPEQDALAEAMQSSGAGLVQLDGISVTLTNGAQLDLGGIAKGYAAGRVRTILREAGVMSAIISLGGNVAAVGKKPDGSAWTVGLQDPDRPESYFGTVSIEAACVVTSGAYQRYFEENGVRYHHILDPYTGCPAESGGKVCQCDRTGRYAGRCTVNSPVRYGAGCRRGISEKQRPCV